MSEKHRNCLWRLSTADSSTEGLAAAVYCAEENWCRKDLADQLVYMYRCLVYYTHTHTCLSTNPTNFAFDDHPFRDMAHVLMGAICIVRNGGLDFL